MFTITIMSDCD